MPAGSLMYLFFCISKRGWGFDNYLKEANTGVGPKIPRWIKPYYKYVMPIIMLILLIQGIVNTFI